MEIGEKDVQRIWKEYFRDLYSIDIQEQVAVNMRGFDGRDPIRRTKIEVRESLRMERL